MRELFAAITAKLSSLLRHHCCNGLSLNGRTGFDLSDSVSLRGGLLWIPCFPMHPFLQLKKIPFLFRFLYVSVVYYRSRLFQHHLELTTWPLRQLLGHGFTATLCHLPTFYTLHIVACFAYWSAYLFTSFYFALFCFSPFFSHFIRWFLRSERRTVDTQDLRAVPQRHFNNVQDVGVGARRMDAGHARFVRTESFET